ncbi:MAG: hypothetical protein A2074_00315 [Candidatus Aquicultor primus]|uniref:Uncharacterized protein n=1 Tax=Candidatus Aquicultor primus TaxID=1797195 RepID=A0A1F2UT43_9ACTN|nr:MAG: hypothetical protein A2074_00315 [Candidatus Aquicultor primus]HCG99252.1 hypothetical protein [Actinomycetota bacterium]
MGDDFFEEQPVEAPSAKKTPQKKSGSAKKAQPGKATGKGGGAQDKPAVEAGIPQSVDLVWTVAFVVVAFVVGFFVGRIFMPETTASPALSDTFNTAPSVQGEQSAPALTEEQAQQGVPQGHPSLGGETTQSGGAPAAPDGFMPPGSEGGMGDLKSDVPAAGDVTGEGQSVEVPPDKKDGSPQ